MANKPQRKPSPNAPSSMEGPAYVSWDGNKEERDKALVFTVRAYRRRRTLRTLLIGETSLI